RSSDPFSITRSLQQLHRYTARKNFRREFVVPTVMAIDLPGATGTGPSSSHEFRSDEDSSVTEALPFAVTVKIIPFAPSLASIGGLSTWFNSRPIWLLTRVSTY